MRQRRKRSLKIVTFHFENNIYIDNELLEQIKEQYKKIDQATTLMGTPKISNYKDKMFKKRKMNWR